MHTCHLAIVRVQHNIAEWKKYNTITSGENGQVASYSSKEEIELTERRMYNNNNNKYKQLASGGSNKRKLSDPTKYDNIACVTLPLSHGEF